MDHWEALEAKRHSLLDALRRRDISAAVGIVEGAEDYFEAELFVRDVLRSEAATRKVRDAALETFERRRRPVKGEHGAWVHGLSHFARELWRLREMEWLQRLYRTAFEGAFELDDPVCCDRLVLAFMDQAEWTDDPQDYGMTIDCIARMNWGPFGEAVPGEERGF